jgi:3-deoxy-manno-octulosonate cytidylyltransferase (CMP-KDO synthetase)
MTSLVIIPARFESSRFPGKPLAEIAGKSLIQRVYEQVELSDADDIIVATDDQRIFDHVEKFDGNVVLTSISHQNGTSRIIEAFELAAEMDDEYDLIINVQGDEPLIDPKDINQLIDIFENEETDVVTLAREIKSSEDLHNPNVVKVVLSEFEDGVADALYFSRSAIPYQRDAEASEWIKNHKYYQHIGIYGFSPEALESIKWTEESPLERAEKLEQLRWLQKHFVVSVGITENASIGVDHPEDIARVEKVLKSKS